MSDWYEPHSFQLVKLLLLTASLANLAASVLALVCQAVEGSRRVWYGHPTPLLLVEAGLTLALLLLLLMVVLGRREGLLQQEQALSLGVAMVGLGLVSWTIGEHYRRERQVGRGWGALREANNNKKVTQI